MDGMRDEIGAGDLLPMKQASPSPFFSVLQTLIILATAAGREEQGAARWNTFILYAQGLAKHRRGSGRFDAASMWIARI